MSVSAPVRPTEAIPYAESQPQRQLRHASPEWLPVIGWFVDDGRRHSRINVVPLGNTTDPHERFAANEPASSELTCSSRRTAGISSTLQKAAN